VTPSDSDLIAQCLASGQTAAFGELVRRHQSPVRGFLRRLTHGDHAWADDLAQETFIQAFRSLGQFRGGSRFQTWLLGIAYNHFRNGRRRQREVAPPEAVAALTAAPDGALADLRHDLSAAMDLLPDDEQLAMSLSLNFGLTHEEIAETTGWPLGTAKTRVSRGKESLRRLLSAWNPSP
jgi:RNA polymerase sigma-70 factor (ECF subfamily)